MVALLRPRSVACVIPWRGGNSSSRNECLSFSLDALNVIIRQVFRVGKKAEKKIGFFFTFEK